MHESLVVDWQNWRTWAFQFYRRGPIPIKTLLLRGSRDRLDLDNTVCLGLDITSKESVQTGEEVLNKLARGHLDVLVDNPGICYTMTVMDTDLEMVKAVFDVNAFGPRRMVHEFYPRLVKAHTYRTPRKSTNSASMKAYVPFHLPSNLGHHVFQPSSSRGRRAN